LGATPATFAVVVDEVHGTINGPTFNGRGRASASSELLELYQRPRSAAAGGSAAKLRQGPLRTAAIAPIRSRGILRVDGEVRRERHKVELAGDSP